MPSVERPAVAILLDSFMPQPYVANITGIKPNVSPRTLSETGEVIYNEKTARSPIHYLRLRFLEKMRVQNPDKECLKITPRTMRAIPARIK